MPKKSFSSDRPAAQKRNGDNGKPPFRKPAAHTGDKSAGKPAQKEDHPFKKFEKGKHKPTSRKTFGNYEEEKPGRKRFNSDSERSPRPARPERGASGDKWNKPKPEEKKPNRYAHTFGRMDDDELAAHKRKLAAQQAEPRKEDEVTFEKELDKWTDKPVERKFGKSDIRFKGKNTVEEDRDARRQRNRHDADSKFKKQFDDENPFEQAYASSAAGKKATEITRGAELEGQPMPLNKYIAHCDVCSRRDAVVLIKDGKVTVNDAVITEPGFKVSTEDHIKLNGERLVVQKNLVYILMNKPKGFITTTDDPKGRRTVMDMLVNHIEERVFPVGRLDRNTTGLLLLTNDGDLTQKLSHPKYDIKKVYKATLDRNLAKADFDKIREGLELEDGRIEVDQLEYLDKKNEIGLEIHSGKNRIVRRIFESLGYEVEKLDRVVYAGLTKKNVLRGKWRFLTKQEVINLKHLK